MRAAEAAGLTLAVALPLLLRGTLFHVVPAGESAWRGLTDPPGAARVAASLAAAVVVAVLLARRPAPVRRPLLWMALAAAPLAPLLTGQILPLLAFQGPVLVVVGAGALAVALVRAGSPVGRRVPALALFLTAWALYALLGTALPGPAGPQGDEPHYLTMAQSLVSDGDLDLTDEFARREYRSFFAGTLEAHTSPASPPGTTYSIHAPGLGVLLLPAYALGGYPAARLFLSAVAALTALLIHRLARDLTGSEGLALATWAAVALTPPLPIYALAVYPETPAALATAVFLWAGRRDPRLPALLAATAAAAALPWLHPKFLPLALVGLFLTLARRGTRGPRVLSAAFFLASVALLLLFFRVTYGQASFSAAYGAGFEDDVRVSRLPWGLLGLFLDRQFGLFAVSPLWVLAVPGGVLLWRWAPGEAMRALFLAGAVLGVGASFSMWWGGACPPARFVVPALPALAVALVPALRARPGAGAALAGAGVAILALAADAPRALHNRANGESGLLRFLAPGLDLDPIVPSFVLGGSTALILSATGAAAAALAWRFGARGLAAGGAAYLLVAGAARPTPFLDERWAARRLLEAYDATAVVGVSGPLELSAVSVPFDLRGAPWLVGAEEQRHSGRLDLPPGSYRVDVRGEGLDVPEGHKTTRVELTADGLLLERVYLEGGRPGLSFALPLPAGVRRLAFSAVGAQGRGRVDSARVRPLALVPRALRPAFSWPRQPVEDGYRVERDGVKVTALDRTDPEAGGFRLRDGEAAFLVEAPPGADVHVRIARRELRPGDALVWGNRVFELRGPAEAVLHLPPEGGVSLGEAIVVPVRLRSAGGWIAFSGRH